MTETKILWRAVEAPYHGILAERVLSASSLSNYEVDYQGASKMAKPLACPTLQVHGTVILGAYSLSGATRSCETISAHALFPTGEARKATRALDRLKGRLREFKFLQPNWNGYGGTAPSGQAVEDCVRMLDQLGALSILPSPTVSGDGEVGLFWEQAGVTIEIGCRGDGRYGYLVGMPDIPWDEDEDIPVDEIRPTIAEALGKLATA